LSLNAWPVLLCPQTWLGHSTPPEFLGVSADDVHGVAPPTAIDACFSERGIIDEADRETLIRCLLNADVACIAHALSALLSMSNQDVEQLVPTSIRAVIGDGGVVFDHIGVEVFGKLEWYIDLFDRIYAPLGINVVHEHIFPSVQVRRALEYDTQLGDVRIGRIYFAHGEHKANLEVFEATQCWKYIALRQAALFAHLAEPDGRADAFAHVAARAGALPEPVGHVAFRVPCAQTVEAIQSVLLNAARHGSAMAMRPYVNQVFFNPADGSTNTKFVMATTLPSGRTLDSQIVEVVSYTE
jgi:hypothetical protein